MSPAQKGERIIESRPRKRGRELLSAGAALFQFSDFTRTPCAVYREVEEIPIPDSRERRCRMYFGGGGLLIVLGIIALVLGYQLIGIILIILGLLAGGFGFYGSRRAP